VCDPDEMLSKGLRLNARYYINKVVLPALDRVFSLVGVNVRLWCVNLFVSLFVCADSCFV
jgi:DNA polymerase elongation subunit (family B)